MREEILDIVKENKDPLSELDIQSKLKDKIDLNELCEQLRTMEENGDLYFTKKGKYTSYENTHLKVGRLTVSKSGYGFVILENQPDIHIRKENMNGAIHNDLVAAEYISSDEGKIVRVINRSMSTFVGEYQSTKDGNGIIYIDDPRIKMEIIIDKDHRNNAMPGHKVIAKPYTQIGDNKYYGEIVKILGHKDDVGVDILSKVYEWDIEPNFSEETMEEIKDIPLEIVESSIVDRKDLRSKKIVTIDGDDAKDFDDAISIEKKADGNYILGVHIADVSYYVKEDTALGRDAADRATSVYLVDRVIPMLPHQLSNGICSLNPNVDRFAMTCEMEVDPYGKVIKYDIYQSVIKSSLRMTYKKVNSVLEKNEIPEGYEDFVPELKIMAELSKIIRKSRDDRGQINFDISEIKVVVNEEGKPIEVKERERGIGEKLIEDFMILANETVAEYITNCGYPMIYRIHEIPKEKNMVEYLSLLKALGHNVVIKGNLNNVKPRQIQDLLDSLKDEKDYEMLCEKGLRAMQKAIYSTKNLGHFALASKCYCHFTSPIRRYPDLTVHRVLREIFNNRSMESDVLKDLENKLSLEAEHSSLKERNSIECERDVDDMKTAEYMESHIGEVYDGKISGVISSGMFVRLENKIEGRVAIDSIKGDYYIVNEVGQTIYGKKNGKVYKLGDSVKIKVIGASKADSTIDFELYNGEATNEKKKEN
ncbi:MAG TPA: ribonuclease R [Bacilli bacterium]|nr:ribonuclease R [Bacilli bacterium]